MKNIFVLSIVLILFVSNVYADIKGGMPVKYISSCEVDLNNDNNLDIAILIETLSKEWQLIVLMKSVDGYKSYLVSKNSPNMYLSCHFGKTINETAAGEGKKEQKIYQTPGTFLKLSQPEGASVAYFWNGDGFTEVWTSD
jgi:hypothetical protein